MSLSAKRIYWEAARRIAEGESIYACYAIDAAACGIDTRARRYFTELFKPHGAEGRGFYEGIWLQGRSESCSAASHRRVVALCLAAAIAESEGK